MDFEKKYGYTFHTYPIHAQEYTYEGSFKRFSPFPTPQSVFDLALLGLPKVFPMTQEKITPAFATPYLESAITEIESALDCNLSEVDHFHHEDYVKDMFTRNYAGIKLPRWPATSIKQFVFKYPTTQSEGVYQQYEVPAPWIYLNKNKVNVVASAGYMAPSRSANPNGVFPAPMGMSPGFMRGWYQPGVVEIVYTAGFKHDKLPSHVADLIRTWAAKRMLMDVYPALFPSSSHSVNIDAVGQSVGYAVQGLISKRLEDLGQKTDELKKAFIKGFSKTVKITYIGV